MLAGERRVRGRRCCDGKETPLQGWWGEMKKTAGLLLEAGLRR
jgi:hypothetical protein